MFVGLDPVKSVPERGANATEFLPCNELGRISVDIISGEVAPPPMAEVAAKKKLPDRILLDPAFMLPM